MSRRIMLVVGEASGDIHGASLLRCLYSLDPKLEVFGVSGVNLKREGLKEIIDVNSLTGMGFFEVFGNFWNLLKAFRRLRNVLMKEKPDLLILIDFPEFNLRLARVAKELNIPVLYYISPQVWAWRPRRTKKIAHYVDQMAVVFPFEVPLYKKVGAHVSFVGHPLLDSVQATVPRDVILRGLNLDPAKLTIAMLPGSRKWEVGYILPVMISAAKSLCSQMDVQFVLIRASTIQQNQIESLLIGAPKDIHIVDSDSYNVVAASDLAWVASGTATLETALLLKPMIIVYRLAWLTYFLARILVRVDHVGMVNIIAGERVVPELIQGDLTRERILHETMNILKNDQVRVEMVRKMSGVRNLLGSPGAPSRVAELAFTLMN